MEPTQPESCRGCSLFGVGKGFVLGCGDPQRAKYAIILEAPGRDETVFQLTPNPNRAFLQTKEECEKEYQIRKRDYPDIPEEFLRRGVPVVGQTGLALQFWIWPKAGIRREECYIDNTIRCLPPRSKSGVQYPTGEVKKEAERHCRQYDRLVSFRPDTILFSLHPAGLLREITPLPLAVKDFEKLRDFTSQGRRVLTLLGGKATAAFARYGANVTKWRGHYAELAGDWVSNYRSLFDFAKKQRRKKVKTEEEEFFGVPGAVTEKIKAKATRPEKLNTVACKGAKRYKGKRPPKCGCVSCWNKYEEINNALQSE